MSERHLKWFITGITAEMLDYASGMFYSALAELPGLGMLFSLTDIYGILGIIIIALTKHSWLRKEVIYLSGYFITAVLLNDYMKIIVALSAIIIIMLRLFGLIKNKI